MKKKTECRLIPNTVSVKAETVKDEGIILNEQDIKKLFNKIKSILSQYTQEERTTKYLDLIDKLERFQKKAGTSNKSSIAKTFISLIKGELY